MEQLLLPLIGALLAHARRLIGIGIKPGDRIALIAETGPEFAACFFGASDQRLLWLASCLI